MYVAEKILSFSPTRGFSSEIAEKEVELLFKDGKYIGSTNERYLNKKLIAAPEPPVPTRKARKLRWYEVLASQLKAQHIVGAATAILGGVAISIGILEGVWFIAVGIAYVFAKLPEEQN